MRILRTKNSEATFQEMICSSNKPFLDRGYSCNMIEKLLSEMRLPGKDDQLHEFLQVGCQINKITTWMSNFQRLKCQFFNNSDGT